MSLQKLHKWRSISLGLHIYLNAAPFNPIQYALNWIWGLHTYRMRGYLCVWYGMFKFISIYVNCTYMCLIVCIFSCLKGDWLIIGQVSWVIIPLHFLIQCKSIIHRSIIVHKDIWKILKQITSSYSITWNFYYIDMHMG